MRVDTKTIAKEFQIDDDKAKKVVALMKTRVVDRRAEDVLQKINKLIGGFGVETLTDPPIGPNGYWMNAPAAYVNMGDTYSLTVLYDTDKERFMLTTWGDFVEWAERNNRSSSRKVFAMNRNVLRVASRVVVEEMKRTAATNAQVVEMFIEDTFPKDKRPIWGTKNLKITKFSPKQWALVNYRTPLLARNYAQPDKLFLNTEKYSVTTSKIQNFIRNLATKLGVKLLKVDESRIRQLLGSKAEDDLGE